MLRYRFWSWSLILEILLMMFSRCFDESESEMEVWRVVAQGGLVGRVPRGTSACPGNIGRSGMGEERGARRGLAEGVWWCRGEGCE